MPTKLFARILLMPVLALLLAAPAGAEELRWKFTPGETVSYVLNRGVEGKINLSGAAIEFNLSMIFDTTWKPTAVAVDGTADVDLTVDRIQLVMSSPLFGRMAYDSSTGEKPEEGPAWNSLQPIVEGMLGETFKTKMSSTGEVKAIEFPKKLADVLAKQQIGENRRQGFGMGGNAFNEKGLKKLIAKSVLPLPETTAKEGTWKQSFADEMPGMGTQTEETTFSVAGDETVDGKKLAKITAVTELMFEPAETPRAELEITAQEGKATFLFDNAAGKLVKADGTQNTSMEISGPQEVTQEIKETVKMHQGKSPKAEPKADKAEEKVDAKKAEAKK